MSFSAPAPVLVTQTQSAADRASITVGGSGPYSIGLLGSVRETLLALTVH